MVVMVTVPCVMLVVVSKLKKELIVVREGDVVVLLGIRVIGSLEG